MDRSVFLFPTLTLFLHWDISFLLRLFISIIIISISISLRLPLVVFTSESADLI